MDYASTVAPGCRQTFAALAAGQIHPVHVRIIEDETRFLSDEDAAKADAVLARQAPGLTFGELRHAAHKLILKLDPEAARKRKEATRGEAHVRQFREASGNAGMVARELPSDEVLPRGSTSSSGPWTCGRPGCPAPCRSCVCGLFGFVAGTGQPRPARRSRPRRWRDRRGRRPGRASAGRRAIRRRPAGPGSEGPANPANRANRIAPMVPEGPAVLAVLAPAPAPAPPPAQARACRRAEPGRAGHPHHPLGHPPRPVRDAGRSDGFGPLDGDDARDLAAAAARHPAHPVVPHRVNPDGTAAAHGCLTGRHPPPGTGPPAATSPRSR